MPSVYFFANSPLGLRWLESLSTGSGSIRWLLIQVHLLRASQMPMAGITPTKEIYTSICGDVMRSMVSSRLPPY